MAVARLFKIREWQGGRRGADQGLQMAVLHRPLYNVSSHWPQGVELLTGGAPGSHENFSNNQVLFRLYKYRFFYQLRVKLN